MPQTVRHFYFAEVDSKSEMSLFFSNKAVRLLLSVSVSIWMAGGCLFGCATGVMGAEPTQESDVPSCHSKPSHTASHEASFVPVAHDMMSDCPLGVNATAATSKSSAHIPEPGREPVQALPDFDKQTLPTDYPRIVPFLHNRDSTHLLGCVFLI